MIYLSRLQSTMVLVLVFAGCSFSQFPERVLFLGNSHTYTNDLPQLLEDLAESGGHLLVTERNTPGGHTLFQHLENQTTIEMIAEGNWDFVILQEQSQIPTIPHWRDNWMLPAVAGLDSMITLNSAQTMLFMTWGWEIAAQHCINGYCSADFTGFSQMQDTLSAAYHSVADLIGTAISPVGDAWQLAIERDPELELWRPDHYHPSLKGSYLSACVFYELLFSESPLGLGFPQELSLAEATFLQSIVDEYTAIETGIIIQPEFQLHPAYPNPFNPVCTIPFSLQSAGKTEVTVSDLTGRSVAKLVNAMLQKGRHETHFDASKLATGMYLVNVKSGNLRATRKITLMK
jgi:hypothetical protein